MAKEDPVAIFGLQLLRTSRVWRHEANGVLQENNLSDATILPLFFINRLGDGVGQTVLAEYMGIKGPSLVRLLDALEDSGLIVRKPCAEDRRAKKLHLTTKGRALQHRLNDELMVVRRRLLKNVSKADLDLCLSVLARIDAAAGEKEMPFKG
ncbi:MAG: MarR family transcriptional regulator [Micavibrio sp.]|nr:MarR family transcriptional regulator [Micavibrio sp.]